MFIKNILFKSRFWLILFILFLLKGFFLFANNNDWTIAVAEFEEKNLDKTHQIYKTIVPQMFLFYLGEGGKRLVPFEEKKLRAVMKASEKKLSLIKERAKLVSEKDDLFLSIEDESAKTKKQKELEKKIKQKEKEIYYAGIDIRIEENKFFTAEEPKNLKLWKDGSDLYKYNKNANLAEALDKEKISALLSGTVRDISGYVVVSVKLDTGLARIPPREFSDAGPYEAVEEIVKNISSQIYGVIQNTKEVKITFDITPKDAKVYIDNKKISDFSKPINLYEGAYQVSASAENYLEASAKINLKGINAYKLKINLKKVDTSQIGFNLKNTDPILFYKTQYASTLPGIITVPKTKSILEFENKGVHSFGLLEGGKLGSHEHIQNMIVKLNKKSVKESVELHRKIMYWSLGALYISLPFTMITKFQLEDRYRAVLDSKLPRTQEEADRINRAFIIHSTFQGISIALGVNYLIQLIIYLVKADRALPKKIKPNKNEPIFKIPEAIKNSDNTLDKKSESDSDKKNNNENKDSKKENTNE